MSENVERIVLEALDKEDPNVLRAGCMMSGILNLKQAERGLLKALNHKAWQIQAEAARALGLIEAQGALPYLRRMLKAGESNLRQAILTAAAGGGSKEEGDETPPQVLKAVAVAINRIKPSVAQDVLLGALQADQANLLGAAMVGLANLEAVDGRQRMVELLAHEDPAVKRAAAACLGKLKEKSSLAGLLALLREDDPSLRKEAIIAMNHIKDKRTLPHLASCMGDADAEVRRVTAIALGNTRKKDPEIVEALLKGIRDREAPVRLASLTALANLKAHQALEEVTALMADTHEDVARQAAVTVTVLGQARETPDYED